MLGGNLGGYSPVKQAFRIFVLRNSSDHCLLCQGYFYFYFSGIFLQFNPTINIQLHDYCYTSVPRHCVEKYLSNNIGDIRFDKNQQILHFRIFRFRIRIVIALPQQRMASSLFCLSLFPGPLEAQNVQTASVSNHAHK